MPLGMQVFRIAVVDDLVGAKHHARIHELRRMADHRAFLAF